MKAANKLIQDFGKTQDRVQYIDVSYPPMFYAQDKLPAICSSRMDCTPLRSATRCGLRLSNLCYSGNLALKDCFPVCRGTFLAWFPAVKTQCYLHARQTRIFNPPQRNPSASV